MAILHVCLDDSGKFEDSAYVALCGWIASAGTWEVFSKEWDATLRQHNLAFFHAASQRCRLCLTDSLTSSLVKLIGKYPLACIGAAVASEDFRNAPEVVRNKLEDPLSLVFQICVNKAVESAAEHSLSLLLDDHEKYSIACYKLLVKAKQKYPGLSSKIAGLCFVNDQKYPPVQAADLLSYVTTQELKRHFVKGEGPGDLYVALTHRSGQPVLCRQSNLTELAAKLKPKL